jgi:hypothetical protein
MLTLEILASRPLNNLAESQLESLLIEGGLLEIYVDQIKLLTKLIHSSRRSNLLSDVCLDKSFGKINLVFVSFRNQKLLVYKLKKRNQQPYVNENPMKFFLKQV